MVPSLLCTFVAHITFLHVFFLPPPFILSLSLAFSFSLSLFLSLSLYLCPLFLSVVARHMSSDALYQIFSSWSILLFYTISFHSSYKIHQLFTDYLLRLPSSELLEKHLFRSRANRRLVFLGFFGPKNRPFWMTGRSKSHPNEHLLDSWAGTSACDRPGIPPSPPKQRSKCRCCKESLSYFSQSLFGGVRGNVPKFEKLWRIRFQSNHFGWNNSAVNFCYFASKK